MREDDKRRTKIFDRIAYELGAFGLRPTDWKIEIYYKEYDRLGFDPSGTDAFPTGPGTVLITRCKPKTVAEL